MENKTLVEKNFLENSVLVIRTFDAPLALVWRAYTESELLDQWWAPQPWKAETQSMDFREGGFWLYALVNPKGEKHFGRMNYVEIAHHNYFKIEDVFCDEKGNYNPNIPVSKGKTSFTETPNGTSINFKMNYSPEVELKQIIEMGFENGIVACFEQLEKLLTND